MLIKNVTMQFLPDLEGSSGISFVDLPTALPSELGLSPVVPEQLSLIIPMKGCVKVLLLLMEP